MLGRHDKIIGKASEALIQKYNQNIEREFQREKDSKSPEEWELFQNNLLLMKVWVKQSKYYTAEAIASDWSEQNVATTVTEALDAAVG